jgi:hypothetical protein
MGGPSKDDKSFTRQIAYDEAQVGRDMTAMAKEEMGRRRELQQPLIDFYQKAISGDSKTLMAATATPIGQLTKSANASKENIYDSIPAGPGRDVALAQNTMNKNTGIASFLNQTFVSAFPGLASLGTESGQVGLQGFGGGLRGFEGAGSTIGNVMQADAQGKAATMGLFGSLAGAAGMATGGYLSRPR